MDQVRSFEAEEASVGVAALEDGALDRTGHLANDERRMHVRAYNFWASLLGSRSYPTIADLRRAAAADFARHAVLLDFTSGADAPAITFLGDELRDECGVEGDIRRLADVPDRSLLSRLTDHYAEIIANRAPIGFEAEFISRRGRLTLYRGVLMPFSSDDRAIDHVYGVINWKELADAELSATIALEVARVAAPPCSPVWAEGPGAALGDQEGRARAGDAAAGDGTAAARIAEARAHGDIALDAHRHARATLHHALGRIYDLTLDADASDTERDAFREALGRSRAEEDALVTALVRSVFGSRIDEERTALFADAVRHARRLALPAGRFAAHVDAQRGGLRALAAAERALPA